MSNSEAKPDFGEILKDVVDLFLPIVSPLLRQ